MPVNIVNQGTAVLSVASGQSLGPADIPALVAYQHTQSAASTTWTIAHNLNFFPNVTVIDSGGSMVEANVTYTNNANLTITFSSAISGVAYLS
jgi:hypothetical protein